MNLAQLRAELEAERAWRDDEIRKLQNLGETLPAVEDQNQYRRALVLVLYAHFEGFCKFALSLYCAAVNATEIRCDRADVALVAASLSDLFRDLRNPDKKSDAFRNSSPEDRKLHMFAREREFVQRSAEFMQRTVQIPDGAVDMESNLTPTVLSKNLFRLGFKHNAFEGYYGDINRLLEFRNKIGHGEIRVGIVQRSYDDLRQSVAKIMTGITIFVMEALDQKEYLREETLY